MSPWVACSLEEEIMAVIESDTMVSIRYLCAVLFPMLCWIDARQHIAEAVRAHCRMLVRARLLQEVGEDVFCLIGLGRA